MLGAMFSVDETWPNIATHDVLCPDKVCRRSFISPDMMSAQMLDQKLDRLHKAEQVRCVCNI